MCPKPLSRQSSKAILCALLAVPATGQVLPSSMPLRAGDGDEATTLEEGKPESPLAGYDGGFFVQSPDGGFKLTVEGLMQFRGQAYERGIGRTSRFDVELEEAWVGADLGAQGPRLILGRMKAPFSLAEMLPRKHLDLVAFSILNQFAPAEDHGVTVLGGGLTRPSSTGPRCTTGPEARTPTATRTWPCAASCDRSPASRNLRCRGSSSAQPSPMDARTRTWAARSSVRTPPGPRTGQRARWAAHAPGLEFAWLLGPFALYAEGMTIDQDMRGPAGSADVGFDGWYLGASRVLSSEQKTFRGVHPRIPLGRDSQGLSGHGAWQLAARVSNLAPDDDLVSAGVVAPSAYPDDVTGVDLGLNWYATYNAQVKLHLVHTRYGNPVRIDSATRDSENAVLVQFQVHF